jgi:hypothetical protein
MVGVATAAPAALVSQTGWRETGNGTESLITPAE